MKKICVITGARSEYGLLQPLMQKIKKDKGLKLQVLVTGSHLVKEFGYTYREIEKAGYRIDRKVDLHLNLDTPLGIAKAMGLAVSGIAAALEQLKPDLVILLGDRYETFCAAAAAHILRIPIAHLHGGEITTGAVDEAFRHAITKMSALHFVSTEVYKKRVIQLGELPETVFNVGAIGIDNIKNLKLLSKPELEKQLKIKFKKHNLVVTFHPVTLENNTAKKQCQDLLAVLTERKDTQLIFTKANADPSGRLINQLLAKYARENSDRAVLFDSLGQLRYLSLLQYVDAMVGNSSSGIIEAPSFKIGTINIGDRQKGRIYAKSVINCPADRAAIRKALAQLYSPSFQAKINNVANPYGRGHTAESILKLIKEKLKSLSLKKTFYDLRY